MNAKLKSSIDRAQMKVQALRAKYSTWNPLDQQTMKGWERMLEETKQQAHFADHPVMKKWVKYCEKVVSEINHMLLNDKTISTEERRIVMEKRDMYKEAMAIFIPREKVLEIIESEADQNLQGPKSNYPQGRAQAYGGL